MRLLTALLILTLFQSIALGQKKPYSDAAFDSFKQGDYNNAIRLYKMKVAQVKYCDTYHTHMIAICYTRMDSLQQAKAYLQSAIDCQPLNYMQIQCCWDLAELYLKEKNYPKALETYHIHETKWKDVKQPADWDTRAYRLFNARFLSKCYRGLNHIDSAIKVLTPYAFYKGNILNPFLFQSPGVSKPDSLKYDTICTEYLTLLKKLHSNHDIKAELKKADQSFYYRDSLPQAKTDKEFVWENIRSGFKFYGVDVVYADIQVADTPAKLKEYREPRYEKAYQVNEFHTSVLYRMIMDLPDNP
jgi:tetratricopeptide (TPR) repeat protein